MQLFIAVWNDSTYNTSFKSVISFAFLDARQSSFADMDRVNLFYRRCIFSYGHYAAGAKYDGLCDDE